MITQTTIETKLADWTTAFYSNSNKQSEQAQILRGLIDGLLEKLERKEMVVISGVV